VAKNKSNRADKIQRREKARKKAKLKKALKICIGIFVAVALTVLAIFLISRNDSGYIGHVHTDACNHNGFR